MIGQELEGSLHKAFVDARQRRHEFITVEHLLMALIDVPSAAAVLQACSVDLDGIRKSLGQVIEENATAVRGEITLGLKSEPDSQNLIRRLYEVFVSLTRAIHGSIAAIGSGREIDTRPTPGFERVLQRAIMHVQSVGRDKREVTCPDVLVAVFGENDSQAVHCLHQQGVTRLDVVSFIAHGPKKTDSALPNEQGDGAVPVLSDHGQVVLLNDDYTPMEFVVTVLQDHFKLDLEAATQVMLKIHQEGRGVCGVFSKDVAATKVELVSNAARRGGHPLQCIMEAA